MKKILMVMIVVFISVNLSACGKGQDNESGDKILNEQDEDSTSIYLATVDNEVDDELGRFKTEDCREKTTEVKINKKLAPQEALEILFIHKEDGLYNALGLSENLTIKELILKNDFAILTLSENLRSSGMCDDTLIREQIVKTLLQFEDIDGVDIFVGDKELGQHLSSVRNEW